MQRYTILCALALLPACIDYNDSPCGPNPTDCDPAPLASASDEGDGTAAATDDGVADTGIVDGAGDAADDMGDGADESGGWDCSEDDDLVYYVCEGWIAGLHKRSDGTEASRRFISPGNQLSDTVWAGCIETWVALPLMADVDNDWVLDECTEQCEAEQLDTYAWLPVEGFTHVENKCIFGPDGFDSNGENFGGGEVPAGKAAPDGNGTVGDHSGGTDGAVCDNIFPGAEQIHTMEYGPDGNPPTCENVSCSGWNPNGSISYSMFGNTITTSMARSYLVAAFDSVGKLYECDEGRYAQTNPNSSASSYEVWKMVGLDSKGNEFLYRMGFRSNDYDLKIKRSGGSWYTLGGTARGTGRANQMTAAIAVYPYNSLVIEFKRPIVGGSYSTITMNLTLT